MSEQAELDLMGRQTQQNTIQEHLLSHACQPSHQNDPILEHQFIPKKKLMVKAVCGLSNAVFLECSIQFIRKRSVSISGTLSWRNGQKLVLKEGYQNTFLQQVNHRGKGQYYCICPHESKQISIIFKQRSIRPIQNTKLFTERMIQNLARKAQDVVKCFQKYIGKPLGLSGSFHQTKSSTFKHKLQIKKQALKLHKKTVEILGIDNKNQSDTSSELSQNQQSSTKKQNQIFLHYQKCVEKDDPPEDQSHQYTILYNSKFIIETKLCKINRKSSDDSSSIVEQKLLVAKKVNPKLSEKSRTKRTLQLEREISIIKKIKTEKNHFLKYYLPEPLQSEETGPPQQLYMEKITDPLTTYTNLNIFNIFQTVHLFKNIIMAVKTLHDCGVVHRDLKPDNILVPDLLLKKGEDQSCIKVIDYSDSSLVQEPYSKSLCNRLGCTLPYSPFQCNFACEQGTKDPKIDSWSLGILLYEIFHGTCPKIYCDYIFEEFLDGIRYSQFSFDFPRLSGLNCSGVLGMIERNLSIILLKIVNFKQEERPTIQTLLNIAIKLQLLLASFCYLF